jgi:hypothetical protein
VVPIRQQPADGATWHHVVEYVADAAAKLFPRAPARSDS